MKGDVAGESVKSAEKPEHRDGQFSADRAAKGNCYSAAERTGMPDDKAAKDLAGCDTDGELRLL